MIEFDWRWPRLGDHVFVHANPPSPTLVPGVIVAVERLQRVTRVGIRIEDGDAGPEGRVVWPWRRDVHLDQPGEHESCPLCDQLALRGVVASSTIEMMAMATPRT